MAKSKSSGGLIFLILVVLAAAGGTGYYYYKKTSSKEPEYSTVKVGRGNVVQSISATGTLTTTSQVTISSQVSGNVIAIGADFNDEVKKGQMLLKIDPTTYQQRLRQAEADLESAKANAEKVKNDTARIEALYKGGTASFVTKQDYDNAIAQLANSKSQLVSREAALENAKTDLERCTIYSPIDGVVLNRTTDVGGTVNVNQSAVALFIIINDLSHLQISADVSEADIGNVKEGQAAFFTVDAYLNQRFSGNVTQVRNYAKNSSGVVTFSVIIDVDNSDRRLKPGMTATAGIIIAERANVLTVTNGALRAKIPAELQSRVIKSEGTPAPAAMPNVAAAPAENPSVAMPGGQDQAGGRRGGPGGGRGGQGGGRRGNGTGVSSGIGMNVSNTPRVLYKVATDSNGKKVPQEVRARLGISDGTITEVVDGLAEGDEVITFVTMPGAAATITTAPTTTGSPFQQGGGNRGGGGNFRGGF